MQGLILQSRICFSTALVPAKSALWLCHLWMVLWRGLRLATGCVGSWAPWQELWCKLRLDVACALPGDLWYELKSDMQVVATLCWT